MEHCSNAFQSGASPKHEWTGWSTKIKLRSYWEDEVHVVFKQTDKHILVCEVRPVSGSMKSRVLHRNLLFPCTYWPVDESSLKEPHRIREIVRYIRKQVPPRKHSKWLTLNPLVNQNIAKKRYRTIYITVHTDYIMCFIRVRLVVIFRFMPFSLVDDEVSWLGSSSLHDERSSIGSTR